MDTTTGRLSLHPRGFGFLQWEDDSGRDTSAFVAPPELNRFLAGDLVTATVSRAEDGRLSASQLELVERVRHLLFGQIVSHRGQAFLRVDREVANTDWRLAPQQPLPNPPEGSWALARVVDDSVVCERILGPSDDPGIERVIARHEIPSEFPSEVVAQARELAARPISHVERRRDLRSLPTVTVDAASTRDIDDAITVLPADRDGAIRLIVSIADVGSLIEDGSVLDVEARRRATSVYLPDRVLPMLPTELSESRLSLLPEVDRECLSAELRISAEGETLATDVYRSLIRSRARLTYERVADFLDRSDGDDLDGDVCELLKWCRTVSSRLGMSRGRRGGMEMSRDEARFGIDATTGRATMLDPVRVTSAHTLVERCMVATNEGVANWLYDRGAPAPYRVHDAPTLDAVQRLEGIARNFGFAAGFGDGLTPLALGAFDRQIRTSPAAPAILSVLMKALGPARYTVLSSPHFGLAAPRYLHFTSPIRRYADLLVHRSVAAFLDGLRPADPRPDDLEMACRAITVLSARASKAESDTHRLLSARFIASRIGQTFDANVTGVRPFGLRVQLRDSLLVGQVPTDALPQGPFAFSEPAQELVGPSNTYAVGMPLRVRAVRTDEAAGRVEFEPAPPP